LTQTKSQIPTVIVLGTTQTLAWASSYYLPAILADPIAADIGISTAWFFGLFSVAMLLSALLGPKVGRTIDRFGGREVLAVSNLVIAGGLVMLAFAHSTVVLGVAWLVLGVGMSLGLYDAGFATLGRIYGDKARSAITGITLIAGFASTVGWPLTAWGLSEIGWRDTCLWWAAAHILLGLPMNRFLLPKPAGLATAGGTTGDGGAAKAAKPHVPMDRNMWLIAAAFALAWFVTAAMAVHFPRLMQVAGASTVEAIAAGALIGPAQVAARVMEAGLLSRFHPIVSARISVICHPIGAAALALLGPLGASAFALIHGGGNGILTIARGTVPLAIFGPENYGYRLGLIGAPARVAQAGAPLVFGLLIDEIGTAVLIVSAGLSLSAFAALWLVRVRASTVTAHDGA
jgi:MFS family permease